MQSLSLNSYFANLASSITVKSTSQGDVNAFDFKKYFPDFLWLLRDVHLLPTGDDGVEVTPTEYLISKVLRRGKSFAETKSDEVGRAILTFFPSIECKTVQSPSSNPEVVRNIAGRQESLDPTFNKQTELLVQYFFQRLRAKKGFAATNLVDGPILAAMAEQYLEAVNDSDAVPCISDTWSTAVEKRCQEVLEKLTLEYIQDMEASISEIGGLPIEEDSADDVHTLARPQSLFGIHRAVLLKKTGSLLKQVGHLVSTSAQAFNGESLSAELEHYTAVFEKEEVVREIKGQQVKRKKVSGGALFKFTQRNYLESRSKCLALFEKLYQQIGNKMQTNQKYSFEELLEDLKMLQLDYFKDAIGPAKWEVYDEKREFIRAQEASFRLLKGYQKETFDAIQTAVDESAKAAELADSVCKLQVQMRNDAELNQKRMEVMQREHQEELQRLHKEETERMQQEQQKYEDYTKAHMQEMAALSEENREEMREQHESMLQAMDKVIKHNKGEISSLNNSIAELTTAIGEQGKCVCKIVWENHYIPAHYAQIYKLSNFYLRTCN